MTGYIVAAALILVALTYLFAWALMSTAARADRAMRHDADEYAQHARTDLRGRHQ